MSSEPEDSFDFLHGSSSDEPHHQNVSTTSVLASKKREDFPFLIADHAFDASTLDVEKHKRDPHAICLSFNQNELAYVHFIHVSGWGDVTLVKSGERGWIPVDYFSGFSDSRAISLLAAIAAFLAQPRSQKLYIAPQRVYTFSEAAINEIISGTKMLLTKVCVLSRDAPLVQDFSDVAGARKALLTELAHLVHVAKHNKHTSDPEIIEKLVRGCYRLLERTLALLNAVDCHPKASEKVSKLVNRISSRSSRSTGSSINSESSGKSAFSDLEGRVLYRMNSFTDYQTPPTPERRLYEVTSAFHNYLNHFLDPNEVLLADPESPSTPSIILALTRHCMLACRELLVVVDVLPDKAQFVAEQGKDELLEEIRRLVSGARSVVASLPPSPATMRVAAAQNMTTTASRCQDLAVRTAKSALTYLRENPGLRLPFDRKYPVFAFEHLVKLSPDSSRASSPRASSPRASSPVVESANESTDVSPQVLSIEDGPQIYADHISPQISPKSELTPRKTRPGKNQNSAATDNSTLREYNWKAPINTSNDNAGDASVDASIDVSMDSAADHGDDFKEDELILRNNGRVRGGSLSALVKWLTGPQFAELEFEIRAFLLTFRLFTTPRDLIIELGSTEPSEGVRHLVKLWVESFYEPEDNILGSIQPMVSADLLAKRKKLLDEGKKYMQIVDLLIDPKPASNHSTALPNDKRSFSNASSSSASSSMVSLPLNVRRNPSFGTQFGTQSALNLAQSFRDFGLGSRRASRQASSDETKNGWGLRSASITAFGSTDNFGLGVSSDAADYLLSKPVSDIANQLTLMWFDIFKSMRPSELLDQRFASSKRSLGLAPHVTQLILSSNHLTAFVGDTILSPELSTKQRARVLKHWVRISDDLFNIGNLNGTVTIVLTLQSSRIVRLSKAWESLGNKSHSILTRLIPLVSPDRNFHEYRKELKSRQGTACVPYMGILLGDLTLIDEGNPKKLRLNSAINFDRYLKTAHAIAAIQPFQHSDFTKLASDVTLQSWLRGQMAKSHSQDTRDSDEQWRRSLLIQPED